MFLKEQNYPIIVQLRDHQSTPTIVEFSLRATNTLLLWLKKVIAIKHKNKIPPCRFERPHLSKCNSWIQFVGKLDG